MRISTSVLKLVYKTETNAHQSGSGVERPLKCIFFWVCVMAGCCVPEVVSTLPMTYNVHRPQCGEVHDSSSQQLTEILEQVSSDIAPPAIQNDCGYIDTLFTENPQLKAVYENSTFIVQTFEQETTDECQQLQTPPVSEALMEVLQNISIQIKLINSCASTDLSSPSGYYFITTSKGSAVQVYCDMEGENCGGEGGWMRVAYVDMTQSGSQCPQGLNQVALQGSNYCGRFLHSGVCVSTIFETYNVAYTQVCGRIRGYQFGSIEGFGNYYRFGQTIEGYYVDGVSLTHGQPRRHIWTYSAALQSFPSTNPIYTCPCFSNNDDYPSPPFIGQDYYCESGTNQGFQNGILYPNDTLWDGERCDGFEVPCCTQSNMPWFIKTLNQSTSDDIELRVCCGDPYPINEDVPLNLIELYIR